MRPRLADGLLLIALLAAIVGGTALYVRQEHAFYYYDLAGYHHGAHDLTELWRQSPMAALRSVRDSMAREYTALYGVPLLPALLVLGTSRLDYEIGLAITYLLPFVLMLGAVATRLLPGPPRPVFWAATVLALLVPPLWLPTLRGYPDTGAAFLVALAVWLYLADTWLVRPRHGLAIGALLAAAMLFRRHFAYAGLTFFGAAGLLLLVRCALLARSQPRRAARDLLRGGWRLGLMALSTVLTLALFGRDFLTRALTTDYYALYASYLRAPDEMLRWAVLTYGALTWLGAGAGLALGARRRLIRPDAARFVALFGGLALVVWLGYVRQPATHYTLHFTPFVVLALAVLGRIAWQAARGRVGAPAAGVLALLVVSNLLAGLAPLPAPTGPPRALFAAAAPPLVRADYDEIARLVRALRALAPEGQPIYFAASSDLLNNDLIANAERALYGPGATRLALLGVPEIDSRDWYPLDPLLRADYVVIVEPYQYHLSADQQDVIRVVGELFRDRRGLARDFEPLPERFALANGVTVTIYRRAQQTALATAIETLHLLWAAIQPYPGGQPDWESFGLGPPTAGAKERGGAFTLTTQPITPEKIAEQALIYMRQPPARATLHAQQVAFADRRCPGARIRVTRVDPRGRATAVAELPRRAAEGGPFSLVLPDTGPDTPTSGLLLQVLPLDEQQPTDGCAMMLTGLRIVAQ